MIVKIAKKGDLTKCGNWRGITLLSVFGKVLGRVIITRISDGIDAKLRREQAGFRRNRSTGEHIFVLRNIIEQSIEWNSPLYTCFIDFEKAFDSVHRTTLWNVMRHYGIPQKIVDIVKAMYVDSKCAVIDDGQESDWFDVKSGVRQGCNMSGFFFYLLLIG